MPYMNTSLIARRGYGGRRPAAMGSFLDDVGGFLKSAASSAIDYYGKNEQQAGAAAALQAQNAALTQALANQRASGPDTTTLLMIGGIGLAAVILLTRKK